MCNYILTGFETQHTRETEDQRGRMRTWVMERQWFPIHIRKTERVSGARAVPRHAKAQEGTQNRPKRWDGLASRQAELQSPTYETHVRMYFRESTNVKCRMRKCHRTEIVINGLKVTVLWHLSPTIQAQQPDEHNLTYLSAAWVSCAGKCGGIWIGTAGRWWFPSGPWCTLRCPAPTGCWCRLQHSETWTSSSRNPSCPGERPGSVHRCGEGGQLAIKRPPKKKKEWQKVWATQGILRVLRQRHDGWARQRWCDMRWTLTVRGSGGVYWRCSCDIHLQYRIPDPSPRTHPALTCTQHTHQHTYKSGPARFFHEISGILGSIAFSLELCCHLVVTLGSLPMRLKLTSFFFLLFLCERDTNRGETPFTQASDADRTEKWKPMKIINRQQWWGAQLWVGKSSQSRTSCLRPAWRPPSRPVSWRWWFSQRCPGARSAPPCGTRCHEPPWWTAPTGGCRSTDPVRKEGVKSEGGISEWVSARTQAAFLWMLHRLCLWGWKRHQLSFWVGGLWSRARLQLCFISRQRAQAVPASGSLDITLAQNSFKGEIVRLYILIRPKHELFALEFNISSIQNAPLAPQLWISNVICRKRGSGIQTWTLPGLKPFTPVLWTGAIHNQCKIWLLSQIQLKPDSTWA